MWMDKCLARVFMGFTSVLYTGVLYVGFPSTWFGGLRVSFVGGKPRAVARNHKPETTYL